MLVGPRTVPHSLPRSQFSCNINRLVRVTEILREKEREREREREGENKRKKERKKVMGDK